MSRPAPMAPPSAAAAPISDLLTLIITTSPTPSSPSTELLESVFNSFRQHCADLLTCRVVVVFDTYERVGPVARLKKGQVTQQGAEDFATYKNNVKKLVLAAWGYGDDDVEDATTAAAAAMREERGVAEYGYDGRHHYEQQQQQHATTKTTTTTTNAASFTVRRTADGRVAFVEPDERLGFGLAVRTALRAATTTPYVWIHQHDWRLAGDVPAAAIVGVMAASASAGEDNDKGRKREEEKEENEEVPPVKYVCLPSVRMLGYAESAHVQEFAHLRALTARLKRDFVVVVSGGGVEGEPTSTTTTPPTTITTTKLPLTPLFFWHDKPHVASTRHYLERVFPTRLAMPRGAFIEDTVGHRARTQMKERGAWARWACWLYYPDEGRALCVRHLDGRRWRGAEAEERLREGYRGRCREKAQTEDVE